MTLERLRKARLNEPLHLNLLSLAIALFGSYRNKIAFDLIVRKQYAYSLLRAADHARRLGLGAVTVAELGVAAGSGLLNLCSIASQVEQITGVNVRVFGFDTGAGLPPPQDYRDHPEQYMAGEFMMNPEKLKQALPPNGKLILGHLKDTIPQFTATITPEAPLGFLAIDVDYYSSTMDGLQLLADPEPRKYLPLPSIYLDDINEENHNSWCGELLALREFNDRNQFRKIERDRFLKSRRWLKHGVWLEQMYLLHLLDYPPSSWALAIYDRAPSLAKS